MNVLCFPQVFEQSLLFVNFFKKKNILNFLGSSAKRRRVLTGAGAAGGVNRGVSHGIRSYLMGKIHFPAHFVFKIIIFFRI